MHKAFIHFKKICYIVRISKHIKQIFVITMFIYNSIILGLNNSFSSSKTLCLIFQRNLY